ncbi:SHOCT domain-containing protein [Streptomyces sp. NPDC051976]|uniref:SHOCT domain-containing protein n=1 Tax=Streptomyces sp. NPDC051976 TaxID=3154947 RepID=UPI00341A12B2
MNYPLLDAFWTMLWFFLWIVWLMLLFKIIGDIFRSDDLGGWGRTGWLFFVILLPFLGVFVYVIARGKSMTGRDVKALHRQDEAARAYIKDAAGTSDHADQLAKLAELKANGSLTDEEFRNAKAKILA